MHRKRGTMNMFGEWFSDRTAAQLQWQTVLEAACACSLVTVFCIIETNGKIFKGVRRRSPAA
eukprot:2544292-Amphidinium_carterae.2